MFLEEHVGKEFLREAGIPVPAGRIVERADQAADAARAIGAAVVIKAQVQAGRRGKAGGILFAESPDAAARAAATLIGSTIQDRSVERVLIEARVPIARELYVAITHDSLKRRPVLLWSMKGGMDIEELHATAPHEVRRQYLDIRSGLTPEAAAALLGDSGLDHMTREALARLIGTLYALYRQMDAQLVEINPLVVTAPGALTALDCKLIIDDSALRRQPRVPPAVPSGTALERRGAAEGLVYIELDGAVGVLANGAGLTMSTMDAINYYGGRPANFMEIGGDAYRKAEPALSIVLANPRVKSLLVNLCGAFARTDVIVEGVLAAWQKLRPAIPVSFSIHGTGEARAIELVRQELHIEPFDLMDDAVRDANRKAGYAS